MENKIVNLQVNDNINETNKSLGTLKSQLREAQNEVNSLSEKFGATSREAVEAAKQAAVLKDKIGDAKALTDAFNPDAKFKAVSASLSGVASGFAAYQGAMGLVGVESKDLEQQLLKVQSAMAIAQGLQGLGEAQDSFKQLKAVGVNAFNAIKAAIGATGIGLIVLAAGAIYAYWDDIKGAVSGVSEEQKRLNGLSQINADQAANKLKDLGNQDNVLKLQGKSEKEILNIKIKATDEAIAAAKINIKNQEISNAAAVEGAKRNYQYLKSAIDFVTIPQRYLYENAAKAINSMINLINKIPGVEIEGRLDEKFGDKANEFITKLAFDPAKTEADGKATITSAKESIDKMVNDRAGMKLAINAIDKTAATDAKKTQDDENKIKEEAFDNDFELMQKRQIAEQESLDAIAAIKKRNQDSLKTEQELAIEKENKLYEDKLFKATQYLTDDAEIKAAQLELENEHLNNLNDINLIAQKKQYDDNKASADALIKIEELKAEAKQKALSAYSTTLKTAASLLGESTDAGKAAAIAATTIDTIQSGVSAFKGMVASVPGPVGLVLGGVAAAGALASGFASVKQILAVKTPNGAGSAVSAPTMSAPKFNVVGQGGANQIAQGMANQEQAPVQAYVVAGAVTSGQALNRNIINNASMG
jgi:hypothetical protein